jgi:hypothetical protein
MTIPTITIGIPSLHLLVRVHDDRATNTSEVEVKVSKAMRREDKNIPFLYLQNQTSLVQDKLPPLVGTKGDDNTDSIVIGINMSVSAHPDVENKARERVRHRHVVEGQNFAKNTKLIEFIRKVFLEDTANNFTDVLQNVCNRLIPLRVVLDGFSQIGRSLIVVAVAVTILVQKMGMNIIRRPITLTANIH